MSFARCGNHARTQTSTGLAGPNYLILDNGLEFVARAILRSLQTAQSETAFIDSGKPWQNGADESFNGTFRDQHLSLQWFLNRIEAKVSMEDTTRSGCIRDWVVALFPKSLDYFTDLGGAGFDGFTELTRAGAEKPVGVSQAAGFACGGHGGAIAEGHWDAIAGFIVTGKVPFEANHEPPELFRKGQVFVLKSSAFRFGIPLAFSLLAFGIVWGIGQWVLGWSPFRVAEAPHRWFLAWLATFVAFVMLAITFKGRTGLDHWRGKTGLALALAGSAALVAWITSSLALQSRLLMMLDPSSATTRAIGATLSATGLVALARFILTRF